MNAFFSAPIPVISSVLALTSSLLAENQETVTIAKGSSVPLNMNCFPIDPGYSATARIALCKKNSIFSIWGGLVYWHAWQSNMEIALKAPFAINNASCGVSWKHGKMVEIKSDFKPGFTLGLGYGFCYDNWDVFAEYTRYHTKHSKSLSLHPGGFLYARWIQPNLISNNLATHIKAHWTLEMDVLNAELERRFYVGRKFIWTPHFGLAAVWIDQKFHGKFSLVSPIPFLLHVHDASDSWAIGPRFGIEGDWYLGCGFSLVGDVGADLLVTKYDLDLKQRSKNQPSIFMHSSDKFHTIRPELDMFLGLSFERYACDRRIHTKLTIGYDFQVWWDQNMIRWYNDSTFITAPQGNLYLQGFQILLRVDL